MPTAEAEDLVQDVRMTVLKTEYMSEYGGRIMGGTVVLVDEKTARRWRQRGIAVDSAETDKTLREQKLAALAALQAEIEAIPPSGVYDASVTRGDEPATMPQQRAVRRP